MKDDRVWEEHERVRKANEERNGVREVWERHAREAGMRQGICIFWVILFAIAGIVAVTAITVKITGIFM